MAPVDDGLQPPRVRLEVQKTPGNPAWFCAGVYGRRPRSGPATSMTSFSSHCSGLPLLRLRSAGPVGLGDDEIGNKVQTALGFRPEITARARRRNRGGASGRLIFLKRERPSGAYSINI